MLVQNSQSVQACQKGAKLFEEINFKLKPNRKALDMSIASIIAKDHHRYRVLDIKAEIPIRTNSKLQ